VFVSDFHYFLCHAELGSASDFQIADPEINSG